MAWLQLIDSGYHSPEAMLNFMMEEMVRKQEVNSRYPYSLIMEILCNITAL